MDLENKVALVTGEGIRIGQAIAVKLGQLGMRVVIHYHHSEEGAKQTILELSEKKYRYLFLLSIFESLFCNQITYTLSENSPVTHF